MEQKPLPTTYAAAIAELEDIVRKMQQDNCDIDNLAGYTARSLQLLKFCKERLQGTDKELTKLLEELQ
ncbi:MAG: exodeoxyribonuclease VII small subunit [Muribaculaceae bacterium]|nr:exodeoxyribonuclease VII small subunit [Bacteroidales bacterium]MDE6243634.1 exodeoxyribonuclease VII small subunit [Muribaculaceae bacterium]